MQRRYKMNYKDTGFRGIYKNFAAFRLNDALAASIEGFPDADKADCVLTYGYIDSDEGLTLEVLAGGQIADNKATFFKGSDDTRSFVRLGAVIDDEFFVIGDKDGSLKKKYAAKLENLKTYDASPAVEKSRQMAFLDGSRDPEHPDDVLVYLTRKGLKPEGCWAKITDLMEHFIVGTLLNEPEQNFGYHAGETIAFYVQKTEDGRVFCYSDMTPSRQLTAEDLAGGRLLKEAVSEFNKNRTEDNFFEVLELLRDSYVWVPCSAVLGDEDREAFEKAVENAGGDLSSLVGKTFTSKASIRLIPEILKSGDKFFFPIFSGEEEMGEFSKGFSKVEKHMLEVIPLARNNERKLAGIVLNAFTEPFLLDADIFDIVENMKSRIE